MAKIVDYRGYTITSIPLQPVGTHEWTPDIKISTERAGVVATQSYTDDTTHIMEEDADLHGIRMGQQIIDGISSQVVSELLDSPNDEPVVSPLRREAEE
jgi:hypothetical protein